MRPLILVAAALVVVWLVPLAWLRLATVEVQR